MAKYVSVRGWIECEDNQTGRIKKIISDYRPDFGNIISNEEMEFYNKGWCFQKEIINWTYYIFYGADIKEYCLDFIKEEIRKILKENYNIDGLFFFTYEEKETVYWKIINSEIQENYCGRQQEMTRYDII